VAERYVIKRNDTLAAIARRRYEDAALYTKLALYNGIQDPNLITVGQVIEIPSRRELDGGPRRGVDEPSATLEPPPPNGLEEIKATFGNIYDYITADGTLDARWETDALTRSQLPFPIPFSVDKSKVISRLQCHKKLADAFAAVLAKIDASGLRGQITSCGGCFNFRMKRTGAKLSTHSWGIAIDINPETNAQGGAGTMDSGVVEIFRQAGFKWGGDWTGKDKDPMHFQYCTGY
jgi:hypothetical protein